MYKMIILAFKLIAFTVGVIVTAIQYLVHNKDMSVFNCFILLVLMISLDNELSRD